MRAERRVKKMKGNLIDQLIMYVQHPPCATREAVGWRWVTLAVRRSLQACEVRQGA